MSPGPAVTTWHAEVSAGTASVLPDGCMDIIFTGETILIAGPDTVPNSFVTDVPRSMTGVRFAPGRGAATIGCHAVALRDRRVDAADLWGAREAARWADRLGASADPSATLRFLAAQRVPDPAPLWIPEVVSRLRGGASVAGCADHVGVTERSLHRVFLRHCGYGPRMLARIMRMQSAMRLLRDIAPREESVSAVAHRLGYADHAHMCRDFRELAGASPNTFRGSPDQSIGQ